MSYSMHALASVDDLDTTSCHHGDPNLYPSDFEVIYCPERLKQEFLSIEEEKNVNVISWHWPEVINIDN